MRYRGWLACVALLSAPLCATDRPPWTGNAFEFETRARYTFETYDAIEGDGTSIAHAADNHYLLLSLAVALWSNLDFEAEFRLADTRDHGFFFEYGRFTTRYLWADDIQGAPFTIATALWLEGATQDAVRDVSTPEVGSFEGEVQLLIGKEWTRCYDWFWRHWLTAGYGFANHGPGWLSGGLSSESRFCKSHILGLYARGCLGLGDAPFPPLTQFVGYASVAYRYIDLEARYRWWWRDCAELSVGYLYRIYAKNYPEKVQQASLQLMVPFSL